MIVGIDGRELQGRPTGTGRYLRCLLRHWCRVEGDRYVVYLNGPPPADPVLAHPQVQIASVGTPPSRGLLWLERELPRAARTHHLDVFFSPAYQCPLGLRVPKVTSVHDLSYFSYPEDFAPHEALRRRLTVSASLPASSRIAACSDFTRRELATRFPALSDRVRHIPLGSDEDLSPPPDRTLARQRLGVTGPLILTVGSVFNRRRLPDLLRAVALIAGRWPGLVLDVVGENRTYPLLDFDRRLRDAGLLGKVRLSGFVDEAALADRYAAADVAVFLSEYEGFGLPALEAAARGVPLVVSDRPSLGEIFAKAAVLVDPRDVLGTAAAIDRLLREPWRRLHLVERGRALAARHPWRATAEATHRLLEEAVGR